MNKELIASYAKRCGGCVYYYGVLYLHTGLPDFFIDSSGNTLSRRIIRQALLLSSKIHPENPFVSGRHWATTIEAEVKNYLEKILLEE